MSYFQSSSGGSSIVSGNLTVTGDLDVQGNTTLVDTTTSGSIIFDTGVAVSTGDYEILRNADGTNLMQFNIPTSASFEWSVNGVSEMLLSATNFGPTTNDGNALGTSGTAWGDLFLASGGVINWNAGDITLTHAVNELSFAGGNFTITQAIATSGTPTALTLTAGAHTGVTAASECTGFFADFNVNKTWAAGAGPLATQREFLISAPTYVGDAGGALTITDAATVNISGAPTAGANMTITNPWALQIDAGKMEINDHIVFNTGVAGNTGEYSIGRNADATNLLQFDVPTGAAHEFTINDSTRVAFINTSGIFTSAVQNIGFTANSRLALDTTGSSITRDVADANVCLIVQQLNASSTGAILQLQNDATTVKTVGQDGTTTITPEALTTGGTNDFDLSIARTLNDPGAAGGSDTYTSIISNITATDVTGWDNIYMLDLIYGGNSIFRVDPISAILQFNSLATDFTIQNAIQGSGNDDAGRSIIIQAGSGGSATTGNIGGDVQLTAGDAGGSGGNDGGGIILLPGLPTGAGVDGVVIIPNAAEGANDELYISHDGTDAVFQNADSSGGFSFLDSTDSSIFSLTASTNVSPITITSSTTDDKSLSITQTLNDPGAAGGSDEFRSLKTNITPTDVTGWDNIYLFDFQYGGTSVFHYNQTTANLSLNCLGASDFSVLVVAQGSGNDTAGRSLSIQSGDAGSATVGDAGGALNLTAGDGKGSGDNDGGNIVLTAGSPSGSGQGGVVNINQPGGTPGTDTLGITHDGTDGVFLNLDSTGGFSFQNSAFDELFFSDSAGFSITQQAETGGSPNALIVTGGAHTTLAAGVEASSVSYDLSATVQFATGAIGTQRAVNIRAPTYAFVGASTITEAATFYIDAAPTAGTNATITSAYSFWVDAGTARFDGRVLEAQGADVASANNLVLGGDGNAFEITGTTEVQLISNLSWQNGSRVTLLFTSTPTVKHSTATSSTNITILLAGAADFIASAGDTLTLILSEIGGTQAWREISRAAI